MRMERRIRSSKEEDFACFFFCKSMYAVKSDTILDFITLSVFRFKECYCTFSTNFYLLVKSNHRFLNIKSKQEGGRFF